MVQYLFRGGIDFDIAPVPIAPLFDDVRVAGPHTVGWDGTHDHGPINRFASTFLVWYHVLPQVKRWNRIP